MLTYQEALDFLEGSKKRGSVLGLTNMHALMEELGNPQNKIPTIHIAGTNGKGSVGAYLASICKEADLKVARYCSPAVFDYLECWQYDGRNITEDEYAKAMSQVKNACDILALRSENPIFPTAFEIETALAFVYFENMQPDVVLLEVGLGGAMDATNVVDKPLACVFTKISRDHMQFLGESLTEIATEKAGIMKPGAHVFWGEQDPEVDAVLQERFAIVEAEGKAQGLLTVRGNVYSNRIQLISQKPGYMNFYYLDVEYETRMAGLYQMYNASLAVSVFDALWPALVFGMQDEMILWNDEDVPLGLLLDMEYAGKKGVENAVWPGRFEVLQNNPLFIMDGAHNEDAALQLAKTIEKSFTNPSLAYIIGVLADKEHKKMLEIMLPFAKKVYCITPPNARGLDAKLLAQEAETVAGSLGYDIAIECCESIKEAKDKALAYATEHENAILAFGSLSYLGELKNV